MKKLRVGCIVDRGDQSQLISEIIEKSKASEHYEISLLIVQRTLTTESGSFRRKLIDYVKRRGIRRLAERVSLAAITRVERIIVSRNELFRNHFRSAPLDSIDIPKTLVSPTISKSGLVYRYTDDDLAELKKAELDVILRGGSGILRGDILTLCEFGIISFHHADNTANRGGPAAFWEVYNREPSTGFVIQRLLDELDGGDVHFKGAIATSPLYVLNLAKLYRKSNVFMHKFLEDLGRTRRLPPIQTKQPYAYRLYTTPTIGTQLLYVAKTAYQVLEKLSDTLRGRALRWGVAYQQVEDWQAAVLWKSKIIDNPPNRFLADPFVHRKDGASVCFVEDYDFGAKRGRISAYRIDGAEHRALGVAIEEPFHLSYPFLFEVDGDLFMCPETHEANDIRLYRCVEFPLKWALHKIIMKNVSAADTSVVFHNDKWWLFTNIDSADMGEHVSELHLFSADAFDADVWLPHQANPVIFNSLRARNGGMFRDRGQLYRVFQVQGFNMYGKSMGVALIKELSHTSYVEEVVTEIAPGFFPNIEGAHSLAFADGVLVVDFVKRERYRN